MIENGAEINITNKNGWTLIAYICNKDKDNNDDGYNNYNDNDNNNNNNNNNNNEIFN